MTMGDKKWGTAMRDAIKADGLRVVDVTNKLNLGAGTIRQLELGKRKPSPQLYEALCSVVPGIKKIPNPPIGRGRKSSALKKPGRPLGSKNKPKVRTKTVKTKPPAGRMAKVAAVKPGKGGHMFFDLTRALLTLKGDKKAWSQFQAITTLSVANGVSVVDLQQLLADAS